MLTVRLAVPLALAGVFAWAPAWALASPADVAATQTYIRANYALVHSARSHLASSEAALAGVLARVRGECPRAAKGSPQDRDSEQLSDEVVGAIVVAGDLPNHAAMASFARTAARLRWSSAKLMRAVRAYAGKVKALSAVAAPNLCADVRAWAASGFQTLPTSSAAFDAQYTPVWVALGELPSSLARFELPGERGLLHASNRLENLITEYEARAVETYAEILDALELKQ